MNVSGVDGLTGGPHELTGPDGMALQIRFEFWFGIEKTVMDFDPDVDNVQVGLPT